MLGYGSQRGAAMPVAPGDERRVSIGGIEQKSVPDHPKLKTIADELEGTFVDRSSRGDLPEFATATSSPQMQVKPGAEYYWWFALAAVPWALFLFASALFWARRAREEIR